MSRDLASVLGREFPRRIAPPRWNRERYSHDAGIQWEEPLAVATPTDEAETRRLVEWCRHRDVPITSRGAGSSIAGNAFGGGLILDFSVRMNRILGYDSRTHRVRVQPGVVLDQLNAYLRPKGRRMGPSPSSSAFCTIGGMIGNNAAGSHSLRYGDTAANLAAIRFLSADARPRRWSRIRRATAPPRDPLLGGLLRLAHDYRRGRHPWDALAKNSSGYLLARIGAPPDFWPHRILCASEGTLGVITEAEFVTHRVPRQVATLLVGFSDAIKALEAVPSLLALEPAALELVDEAAVQALVRHHRGLPRLVRASAACLVLDVQASSAARLRRQLHAFGRSTDAADGFLGRRIATDPGARERLWAARRDVEPLLRRLGGRRRPLPFIEDASVPVPRQVEYLRALQRIFAREGLWAPLYGHAGQGNLHVRPFLDPNNPRHRAQFQRVNRQVARMVARLGGSLTGEHGDGYLRTGFLKRLYPHEYRFAVRVKRLFDPEHLLNPGKIVETLRPVRPTWYREGPRYEPPPWTRVSRRR